MIERGRQRITGLPGAEVIIGRALLAWQTDNNEMRRCLFSVEELTSICQYKSTIVSVKAHQAVLAVATAGVVSSVN